MLGAGSIIMKWGAERPLLLLLGQSLSVRKPVTRVHLLLTSILTLWLRRHLLIRKSRKKGAREEEEETDKNRLAVTNGVDLRQADSKPPKPTYSRVKKVQKNSQCSTLHREQTLKGKKKNGIPYFLLTFFQDKNRKKQGISRILINCSVF